MTPTADLSPSPLLQARRDGDLLRLELADPGRANALSPALAEALTAVYRRDWRAEGVRAILLSAQGKHFSGGADLEHLARLRDASLDENREDSRRLRDLFASVLEQPALTVAQVHGACVAGGCGLATAHDFVVAADDATFLYSEVRIGFVAALVATYLELRLRGRDLREVLLFPEPLSAARALELGIANRVVPRAELASAADALVAAILANGSSESIARSKRLLLDLIGRPLGERLDLAAETNAQSRLTADCRHGIATFLATKKPPRWRE